MLSPKPQLNLRNAREYFREHLCVGDYYAEGQKVVGHWFGHGAEILGLSGVVGESEFLRLCEGRHPVTGDRLTQRLNSIRRTERGKTMANRRVFYDFTISPPKSVSVMTLLQDDRIFGLHEHAVLSALAELEKFSATRVRILGQRADRTTGNIIAATFRHDTSRELDPHLHTHCVVLNATFDAVESRWKALEAAAVYHAQKFIENLYYHELCRGLRRLGYQIEHSRTGFEIKGVPTDVIGRFSKRHQQIDAETARRVASRKGTGNLKDVREQVAHDARRRKIKAANAERLRPAWLRELNAAERAALGRACGAFATNGDVPQAGAAVAWADEHLFERRSVVHDFELLSAALSRGRGGDFDLASIREEVRSRGYLREPDSTKLTSGGVLRCELDIVMAARGGRGRYAPLQADPQLSDGLSAEQRTAVARILSSRDFITLFRGGAGTGKSYALKEVERGLKAAGHPVVALAPQRQQTRELAREGLPAETVAHLLATRRLPRRAVVVVDEAGQIGGRDLREIIRLVQAYGGRLILSGDTRQHGAVAASDALRALEAHGRLRSAEIETIRRQDPDQAASAAEARYIRSYRAAVKAAADGDWLDSYERLDRLGCMRESAEPDRRHTLAAEYLAAAARNEKVLVVGQTWAEVRAVNETIRAQLRTSGRLGPDRTVESYQVVDATEAQKRDPAFYQPGHRVYFLQRYGRFSKGEFAELAEVNERGLVLRKGGRRSTLSFRYAERFAVVTATPLNIARGDRLLLKFNGRSKEGATVVNGELATVHRVRRDGAIVVLGEDGQRKTLTAEQRLFQRGYAVTSYASQGKTVDTVLLADAANPAATNREQWYVAISRARRRVVIFTPDQDQLRSAIRRSGARELALDLRIAGSQFTDAPPNRKTSRWRYLLEACVQRVRSFRFQQTLRSRSTVFQPKIHL